MTLTCAYEPCSEQFEPTHWRQIFCGPTCRANQHYLDHPEKGRVMDNGALRSVATHRLADARGQQESSDLKSKLSQIIYSAIVDRLKYAPVHADDLESAFPEQYRDICRKLVGAQFGSLASRHYIEEVERRKSSVPSRKGAKSGVFAFTAKGRHTLVGTSADPITPLASSLKPGDVPGVSTDSGESEASAGRSPVADPAPSAGQAADKRDQGRPPSSSAAGTGSPENSDGGRDRQVRGAGSAEPGEPAEAAAGAAGSKYEDRALGENARRNTQPARLQSDDSLTLFGGGGSYADSDQRAA